MINLANEDTANILKECNAGVKMGVDSIANVLDDVNDTKLKEILTNNKEEHQKIGSELHEILNKMDLAGKEPNPMAKTMSWLKTNVMMTAMGDDSTVADLITDGCNMGVKSLSRYLNQYKAAEPYAKDLTRRLIDLEHQLTIDVRPYL